jgi:thiamine transporter ThiT
MQFAARYLWQDICGKVFLARYFWQGIYGQVYKPGMSIQAFPLRHLRLSI